MRTALALIGLLLWSVPLSAQTTLKISWDQNAAVEGVTSYKLTVDGAAPITVPNTVSPSCACIQVQLAFTPGAHLIRVAALAPLLSSDPSALVEGPAAIVTFTLNPGSHIKNVKITK